MIDPSGLPPPVSDPDRYLKNEPRTLHTQRLSRVEHRILDGNSWWKDHAGGIAEWSEMVMIRVCVGCAVLALLVLAEMVGPVAYLECNAPSTSDATLDRWMELNCDYRVGSR